MLAIIRGLENWRHLLEDKNLLQNKLLTNGDGPYASYFHHMIKTYIWWELSFVIAAVRLILEDN